MKNTECCNQDCNQGRTCPVRMGTHKPAEAVHQIAEPQPDAQALAECLQKDVWQATPLRLSKVVELSAETLIAQRDRITELEAQLAAAQQAVQAMPFDDAAFQAAIDMLHSARVELDLLREALNVPVEPHQSLFERVLDAAKATHPTQQGLDAIAALQKVRDIAVSALLTGSLDRQDWIDDMDRIAAQAKQGGAA